MTKLACWLLAGFGMGPLSAALAAPTAGVNVQYRGELVAEPCTLLPEDENILLDFGTVIDKYLYLNSRTQGKLFQLHLMDCDVSLNNMLKITFSGPASTALPGLLALDGVNSVTGIAIGMETPQGQPLPLNQQTNAYQLRDGNNVINLQAYVRGEPEAINNKAIGRGVFTGIATFRLDYE